MPVSGPALTGLSVGAVFVYGGIMGKSPLTVLYDIVRGTDPRTALQTQGINLTTGQINQVANGGSIVAAAESQIGKPYVWDAPLDYTQTNPSGFDCSGLTQWSVYHGAGVKISHNTVTQYSTDGLTKIPAAQAQPGDLVFYGVEAAPHHVAIFVDAGTVIDAYDFGTKVQTRPITATPNQTKYVCRVAATVPGSAQTSTNPLDNGTGRTVNVGQNQNTARMLMGSYGFGPSEWPALQALWQAESSWDQTQRNHASGAYGIPQALPESKLPPAGRESGGSDPTAQIRWGLGYIKQRYGTPSKAWQFHVNNGWY